MIGLSGSHETILLIHARHSDVCRFNPGVKAHRDNYDLVKRNMADLISGVLGIGKYRRCFIVTLSNTSSGHLRPLT